MLGCSVVWCFGVVVLVFVWTLKLVSVQCFAVQFLRCVCFLCALVLFGLCCCSVVLWGGALVLLVSGVGWSLVF